MSFAGNSDFSRFPSALQTVNSQETPFAGRKPAGQSVLFPRHLGGRIQKVNFLEEVLEFTRRRTRDSGICGTCISRLPGNTHSETGQTCRSERFENDSSSGANSGSWLFCKLAAGAGGGNSEIGFLVLSPRSRWGELPTYPVVISANLQVRGGFTLYSTDRGN